MYKILLFLFIFANTFSKKLVLDYGAFLKIEDCIKLHNKLEEFNNNYGIEMLFVTLSENSNCNYMKSIETIFEKDKSRIIFFRKPNSYEIYFYNFNNEDELRKKINFSIDTKDKEYFKEFINLIKEIERQEIYRINGPKSLAIKSNKRTNALLILTFCFLLYWLKKRLKF